MNCKKFILLGWVVLCVFAVSPPEHLAPEELLRLIELIVV
jgi:hypothetical protein